MLKVLKRFCFFIVEYVCSLRWIFKDYSIIEQVILLKKGGKKFFCNYIIVRNNYKRVQSILKKEKGHRKIRVCFLVSESSKWNMQSLYDELLKSDVFYPFIVVTNLTRYLEHRPSYQRLLGFYQGVANNVEVGWDECTKKGLDLERFSPDMVFYQQPWELFENQNVKRVSSFALTFYCSYAIEDAYGVAKAHLRDFYSLLTRYFVFSDTYKDYFQKNCPYTLSNISAVSGHPKLDVYTDYHPQDYKHKYVIYAPHHAFEKNSLRYGTFPWSGQFILNWAKSHPEIDWVFKPHPRMKIALIEGGIMNSEEAEHYYDEWRKIGIAYEDGNYFGLFLESKCLITDCGSFLTEYLPTQMPVIQLCNEDSKEFTPTTIKIIDSYYKAFDTFELHNLLEDVVLKKNDTLKNKRLEIIRELGLNNNSGLRVVRELDKLLS